MNQQWRLARTPPAGWPTDGDFEWAEASAPEPGPGQCLTETLYLSLDPYQWGRRRSGAESPGSVCHGRTVSRVLQSRHPDYQPGDYLFNTNGWQRCGLTGDGITDFGYMHPRRLDPTLAPLSSALGVMGMLGLTAYAGMLVQCQPIAGETVVVSAASGGVGQIAGQLAKVAGARVVGIAGDPKKVAFCKARLGFDDCVSHLDPDYPEALQAACPDGVDVYFENVGGKVFEGVLPLLNAKARITLCGMIAQYGDTSGQSPRDTWLAAGSAVFSARKVQVHPLFVGDYVANHQAAFLALMGDYLRQEKVMYLEDFRAGLEVAPTAFGEMLRGGNFGKTLVVVQDP
mgnify:FL=1